MARTKQLPTKPVVTKKGGKPKNEKAPRKIKQVLKTPKKPKVTEEKEKKRRSTVDAEKKERKPRRFKASTIAAREHKRYSTGKDATKLLLQKKPFQNLVRERLQDWTTDCRISKFAFRVIQEGMESWLERVMEKTVQLTRFKGRMSATADAVRLAVEAMPDRELY